jgi:crotonobetainyl-CoA:carnitine CoA-transferase CaiB-like acyl-CoA transferase
MTGPLAGVRVLEMGSLIAGPFAGQLLGDFGADVIKIEPVEDGDPMRRWGQTMDGRSLWWPAIARNKRSVAVNLREGEGQDLVRTLAARCDIVIENFRPGTLAKWGLDYARLAELNPALVLVHVSGFGQTGPRSGEAGFGSIGEAVGGIRFTTGDPDHLPSRAGISLGDSLAALFAVIGALSAYAARQTSGRGQEVDVAIYEAVAALMESTMTDYERAGVLRTRTGSVLPGVAPSNVYRCADGGAVVIAANADGVFRRLCQAMRREDLATDERYAEHAARGRHAADLDVEIQAWCAKHDAAGLLAILAEHGVPAGKIYTAADMVTDPHYLARDMVLRPLGPLGPLGPMAGIVPKFSATPGRVRHTGPELGEHTRDVLRDLAGLSDEQITTLAARGLVHESS